MTGQDVLRQVRKYLDGRRVIVDEPHGRFRSEHSASVKPLLAALDGCVLLTREEADAVHQTLVDGFVPSRTIPTIHRLIALLTPEAGDE